MKGSPDQNYTTELHYLYKPNSLVTDTTGTWISEHAKNALLYGSLVEAYTFMKGDADMMNLYEKRFNLEILRLGNWNNPNCVLINFRWPITTM